MTAENQSMEWKESWRDEYLKWVCGFANAEGGMLIIGCNDRGEVVGIDNAQQLLVELPNKVRDLLGIMVDVNLRTVDGKDTLEIQVAAYPNTISYRGEYYYRSGSTNQTLKGAALDRFLLRKYGRNWDDVPIPNFSAENCSSKAIRLFKTGAAKSGRIDEHILDNGNQVLFENLKLIENHYFKRATALLFSEEPNMFVLGAYIKLGFFLTDDELRYQDEIHGDLFTQVEQVLEVLKLKYLKAYISYEGIQRLETYLFPLRALREAILNAVIHKDYASGIPIQISVYEHQIVIWNPGKLPENWTLEKLLEKHPSHPYNPLLANAFFRAGYIEAWGRGIEKIYRECREHSISPPQFDHSMSGLMVTFHANPSHLEAVGLGEKVGEKLDEIQEAIIQAMQENPKVSQKKLADTLGVSTTTIEKSVQFLRIHGYVSRIGPANGGIWKVSSRSLDK